MTDPRGKVVWSWPIPGAVNHDPFDDTRERKRAMTAIADLLSSIRARAAEAQADYIARRIVVESIDEDADGWIDVLDRAAFWAHTARAWLAVEHDARADLKVRLASEGNYPTITAADRAIEGHPEYRARVTAMREAERMLALAEARQRHADLRVQCALRGSGAMG